ncbi:hypothetical protein LJC28_00720 [Dysgonomonas sp. OttesenSCG-928-D17]|nr:hypothetical protein [Dysgonomonas sp. OttesenSCG-928-D17]
MNRELKEATDEYIRVMSDVLSTNEEVNAALQPCFKALPDSNEDDVNEFMKRVFSLSSLQDIERASLATTICGYLIERGFPGDAILNDFIDLYDGLLNKALPFYKILFYQLSKIDPEDEERNEKVDELYSDLINDKELVSDEVYAAITGLDKFYACGISLFSISKQNFYQAKERLQEKVAYVGNYNQGCYWFSKLFDVLFDEPVVVIDIDNKVGFTGKISGIADNYQLQHLLMGIPQLNNGGKAINDEDLAVANGSGEQITERSIESKWNMYNLELCSEPEWKSIVRNKENPSLSIAYRDSWIWSEGTPKDITIHNGYRVILLGIPSVSRSSRVQRTFKNLKAGIEIERELSADEIDKWLNQTI